MKRILWLLLLVNWVGKNSSAQEIGNEWINYTQSYYKVKIWNDGLYRISAQSLLAAIPELASVEPQRLQIFGRGSEQFLHIDGGADSTWDANDFL
jgi:hypothetical protein